MNLKNQLNWYIFTQYETWSHYSFFFYYSIFLEQFVFNFNLIHHENTKIDTINHGSHIYAGVGSSYRFPQSGKNFIEIKDSAQIVKYVKYLI